MAVPASADRTAGPAGPVGDDAPAGPAGVAAPAGRAAGCAGENCGMEWGVELPASGSPAGGGVAGAGTAGVTRPFDEAGLVKAGAFGAWRSGAAGIT